MFMFIPQIMEAMMTHQTIIKVSDFGWGTMPPANGSKLKIAGYNQRLQKFELNY